MVTLTNADNALKKVYLDVVSNQLNTNVNPFFTKIEQTSRDVWGKEIVKVAPFGINGGIGAGEETGALPQSAGNSYVKFVTELKNLYGKIEISDKAMRASENSVGAFVNLLNAEMEGLIKASQFNFGRMLFGDGSGKLATIAGVSSGVMTVDTVKNMIEGLVVDIYSSAGSKVLAGARITAIDRINKTFKVDKTLTEGVVATAFVTVQNSYGKELTGLGAIFGEGNLYGVDRSANAWMTPYKKTISAISDTEIQTAIDYLDENVGSAVDYITCSSDVKRAYQAYLATSRQNVDFMELQGGYKAISYNGIPVVSDRFVEDGTMYLLNTKEFALHQLCDWQWISGEDGRILKQNAGYATYSATLVKYADLICNKPAGLAKLTISAPAQAESNSNETPAAEGEGQGQGE
ncbi:MAG: phage major capsid protein [Clostridia bacterium]|nr:phage major capsid protein [Clostridia bacterium]